MDNINFIYLERAAKAFDRCINDATTGSVARALYNAKEVVLSEVETMYNVQPVRRGRWIIADDVENFIAICSECGRTEDSRDIKDMPYCHCGARMDGEQNE